MSEASSTSVLLSVNNQENQLDNTDNDVEDIEEIQTKRGTNTVYDEYATYAHIAEFVESLEQGQTDGNKWSKKEKRVTELGKKQFYKCSSCSKKMLLLKLRTSLEVQVCIEDCLNQHSNANSKEAWEKSNNRVLEMYQKDKLYNL
ncbi:hypothetical protein BpHYR1_027237 [Brachionus plicatilis]|uniref:Uncharacterized protein n=1 Tax=Brachionus plicatilis TaxID=10195 RepID=A0A3M7SNB9_BRAPC|nr:hypothetical protein BpHYR1_027237 [Brachionus plicatilis]